MQGLKVLFVVFDKLRCGDLDGALSCPVLVMIKLFYPLMCCYLTLVEKIFFLWSRPNRVSVQRYSSITLGIIKYFQVLLGKIFQVLSITINYFIVLIPKWCDIFIAVWVKNIFFSVNITKSFIIKCKLIIIELKKKHRFLCKKIS